jgi:hypothetical protein
MRTPTLSARRLWALIKEQQGRCAYCGTDLREVSTHKEHVIPFAWTQGFGNDINIVLACARCNGKKGTLMLDQERLTIFIYKVIQEYGTAETNWPEGAEDYWKSLLLSRTARSDSKSSKAKPTQSPTDDLSVAQRPTWQASRPRPPGEWPDGPPPGIIIINLNL